MTGQRPAQPDKRADHEQAHLHGPGAAEYIRHHQRTMLGERVWLIPSAAV